MGGTSDTFTVVAGEHSLTESDGTEQTRQVAIIKIHQDYNEQTRENDIALLKLRNPFIIDSYYKPIKIPNLDFIATGIAVASGWGASAEEGIDTDQLQKVSLPIISDNDCRYFYGSSVIVNSMICAGFKEGGQAPCSSDTGGPLTVMDEGQPVLAGITSWSYGCGRSNYPGVFTEVAKFSSWIASYAT